MDYMTPRQGEVLTLPDGRAFRFTAIEPRESIRGWWWKAIAASGESVLQGNVPLRRCGLTNGWRCE